MAAKHIVALGGGGFSMETSPVLDDYVLGLAARDRPRICFVPTASGDSDNYTVRFYKRTNTGHPLSYDHRSAIAARCRLGFVGVLYSLACRLTWRPTLRGALA